VKIINLDRVSSPIFKEMKIPIKRRLMAWICITYIIMVSRIIPSRFDFTMPVKNCQNGLSLYDIYIFIHLKAIYQEMMMRVRIR
jgi:hypothetical protein